MTIPYFLFTGSFNPIHPGHLSIIEYLSNKGKVITSSIQNPFKPNEFLDICTRNLLLKLAIKDWFYDKPELKENIIIDENLQQYLYTIEQAEYIQRKYNIKPIIILGPDYKKDNIKKFYKSDILLQNCKIMVLDNFDKNISSTDIRNYINNNQWNKIAEIYADKLPRVFNILRAIFASFDPATPKVAVDAIIYHKDLDKFIFIERNTEPKVLSLVGGFVSYGENPESAIKREIFEEVGLTVDKLTYLHSFYQIQDTRMSIVTNLFYAEVNGKPKKQETEVHRIILVDKTELSDLLPKLTLHSNIFKWYLKKFLREVRKNENI